MKLRIKCKCGHEEAIKPPWEYYAHGIVGICPSCYARRDTLLGSMPGSAAIEEVYSDDELCDKCGEVLYPRVDLDHTTCRACRWREVLSGGRRWGHPPGNWAGEGDYFAKMIDSLAGR